MDGRSTSPEIDVVGDGNKTRQLLQRSKRFSGVSSGNSTSLRAPNKNGANLLVANTKVRGKKNAEVVNLRVRNMGIIKVKKEPESDEDCKSLFAISSLLDECDFEKTSQRNNISNSPTLSGPGRSNVTATTRSLGPSQGRPRQSLENVISSLKSAKEMNYDRTSASPPLPMPPKRIRPVAQTVPKVSDSLSGDGPHIIDVRSLASVVGPSTSKASVPVTLQQPTVPSLSSIVVQPASSAASGPKPLNIRFVLPANVPFSTDQFQKVLQATLASISTQSVAVEPEQLHKAIQAALTCVTKSTVAFNPDQLKQAILSSLTSPAGSTTISQLVQTPVLPSATSRAHLPKSLNRPQAIAPKPPSPHKVPMRMQVDSLYTQDNRPISGRSSQRQFSLSAAGSSPVVATTKTRASDGGLVVNGNSNNSSSSSDSACASNLKEARDKLVKALQQNRVLNVPSLSSTATAATATTAISASSPVQDQDANIDCFDHDSDFSLSTPAPNLPAVAETPVSSIVQESTICNAPSAQATQPESNPPAGKDVVSSSFALLPETQKGSTQSTKGSAGSPSGSVSQAGNCTPSVTPAVSGPQVKEGSKSSLPAEPQIYVSTQPVQETLNPESGSNINLLIAVPNLKVTDSPVSSSTSQRALAPQSPNPADASKINMQISDPNDKATNSRLSSSRLKKASAPQKELPPTGCGCCSKCKSAPESKLYICHHKGCGNEYNKEQGLQRHYHYNPHHKPRLPLERASQSVDHFLPADLLEAHRSARLRELLKRLGPEEIKDLVLPRVAKSISLFELLEVKSTRSQVIRGIPDISAFKMFSEFERFRKEVENRLLALILLPQGKGRGRAAAYGDAEAATAMKAENLGVKKKAEESVSPTVVLSDVENESLASNTRKVSCSSNAGTQEKNMKSVTIDLEKEESSAAPGTSSGMVVSSSVEKCLNVEGSSSSADVKVVEKSVDKGLEETPMDSTEQPVKESKQAASTTQSHEGEKAEVVCSTTKPHLPMVVEPESANSSSTPAAKDSVSVETSDLRKEEISEAFLETARNVSGDVTMIDADKLENSSSDCIIVDKKLTCDDGESHAKESTLGMEENSRDKETENKGSLLEDSQEKCNVPENNENNKSLPVHENEGRVKEDTLQNNSEKGPAVVMQESKVDDRSPAVLVEENKEKTDVGKESSLNKGENQGSETVKVAEDRSKKSSAGGSEQNCMQLGENGEIGGEKSKGSEENKEKTDVGKENSLDKGENKVFETVKVAEDRSKNSSTSGSEQNAMQLGEDGKAEGEKSKGSEENKEKTDVGKENSLDKVENKGSETVKVAEDRSKKSSAGGSEQNATQLGEDGEIEGEKGKGSEENKEKTYVGKESSLDKRENKGSETVKVAEDRSKKSSASGSEQNAMQLAEDGKIEGEKSKGSDRKPVEETLDISLDPEVVSMTVDDIAVEEKETQTDLSDLKQKLSKMLAEITFEDEEDMNEENLLKFGLPFAIKWGKIIKSVRHLEAKKIARKENYCELDMKQFIYDKPKEAASAVISGNCHAHPSFFRAYVMPALLDKHIDDFGLFGKKLLSRLFLSQKKYVDILRSSIGPEFAKVMGINIFPTFKRINDTWKAVKVMTPEEKVKRNLVLELYPKDELEVPDEEDGSSTASSGSSQLANPAVRGLTTAQNSAIRAVTSCAPNATGRGNDQLKRPGQDDIQPGDACKKAKLDKSDLNEADQAQATTSTGVCHSNVNKNHTAQTPNNSEKDTTNNKDKLDKSSTSQANQLEPTEKKNETPSGGKSTSEDKSNESTSSISQAKPSTSVENTASKPPSTTNSTSLIPTKAMIYTSSEKGGTSSLPFSTAKGSPLYLVPVEKLSPKLVEQFINQGKSDGIKTRSARTPKKGKQAKPGSQVLVLIPSSTPNGSPTIHTLTSEEQLKADGDKKPMLLLPADKVPKSMASQAPTVRKKMMITVVAPSSKSGTSSAAQNVTTTCTSTSSAGSSQDQLVRGSITRAVESNAKSNTPISKSPVTSEGLADSVGTSPSSSVPVVQHSATLNTPMEVDEAGKPTDGSSHEAADVGKVDSTSSKERKSPEETASTSKTMTSSLSDASEPVAPSEKSQSNSTSVKAGVVGKQGSSGELDFLPSLLPSDLTLDNLLKDIAGESPATASDELVPFDVSEIIQSIENMPNEPTSSSETADLPTDTVAAASERVTSEKTGRDSELSDDVDKEPSHRSKRQSQRRLPTSPLSTTVKSSAEAVPQNTSGESRENSDTEDGSPPQKRRRTPTRAAAKSSRFVSDKELRGKSPQGSPTTAKTRKQ